MEMVELRLPNLIILHILPKYRGFTPLVNMLIGEKELGVTAIFCK
jgi:methionyl-tRNA formyltransferase